MIALVDNEVTEFRGNIRWENGVPVANHSNSFYNVPYEGNENFKFITGGHVYVANYNKKTFVSKPPMTFKEYRKMSKNNKDFKL